MGEEDGRRLITARAKGRIAISLPAPWPNVAIAICVSTLAGFAILAPIARLYEFADAAFFSIGIVTQHSWSLVWCNFSGRLSAYLLTIAPAELMLRLGARPEAALQVYSAIFWSLPLLSLALSRLALPRDARANLITPAVFFVAGAMLVYGFPTETWIMASLFWPTLYGVRYLRGWRFAATAPLLLGLFIFSHEMMILGLPLLVGAAALRNDGRRYLVATGAIVVALVAAYAAVKLAAPPRDAETAKVLASNAKWLTTPAALVSAALECAPFWLELMGCLTFLVLFLRARRSKRLAGRAGAIGCMAATFIVLIGLEMSGLSQAYANHEGRYHARVVMVPLMLAFGLVALVTDIRSRAAPADAASLDGRAVLGLVCAIVFVQTLENGRFLGRWSVYRAELREVVADGRGVPGRLPYKSLSGRAANPAGGRFWALASPWAAPFQSVLLVAEPRDLVVAKERKYRPVTCARWKAIEGAFPSSAGFQLLKSYLCK